MDAARGRQRRTGTHTAMQSLAGKRLLGLKLDFTQCVPHAIIKLLTLKTCVTDTDMVSRASRHSANPKAEQARNTRSPDHPHYGRPGRKELCVYGESGSGEQETAEESRYHEILEAEKRRDGNGRRVCESWHPGNLAWPQPTTPLVPDCNPRAPGPAERLKNRELLHS